MRPAPALWAVLALVLGLSHALIAVAQSQPGTSPSDQSVNAGNTPAAAEPSPTEPPVPVSTIQAPSTQAPAEPGPSTPPSAESVIQELLQKRQQNSETALPAFPKLPPAPPAGLSPVDPSVFGSAPHLPKVTLRREGEFINARRGRVIRSPDGSCLLFVFEADDQTSPEPPMILAPCQLTERLENMVKERGERLLFIASGQVLVYHGVNYLLPTVMKETFDRGNLQP